MQTKNLTLLSLLFVILISGCTQQVITCDSPYIGHGVDCCLDQNNNSICDSDEQNTQQTITSCGDNICQDDENCYKCPLDCGVCECDKEGPLPISCSTIEDCKQNYTNIITERWGTSPPVEWLNKQIFFCESGWCYWIPSECGATYISGPCGDGTCAEDENCYSCSRDCGYCECDMEYMDTDCSDEQDCSDYYLDMMTEMWGQSPPEDWFAQQIFVCLDNECYIIPSECGVS